MNSHQLINDALKPDKALFFSREQLELAFSGSIVSSKQAVRSVDFCNCTLALFINLDTNAALLSHLSFRYLGKLNNDFQQYLEIFSREPGEKMWVLITETDRYLEEAKAAIEYLLDKNFRPMLPTIHCDSGQANITWKVLYEPLSREISVQNQQTKMISGYKVFPEIDPQRLKKYSALPPLEDRVPDNGGFLALIIKRFYTKFNKFCREADSEKIRDLLATPEGVKVSASELLNALPENPLFENPGLQIFGDDILSTKFSDTGIEQKRFEICCYYKEKLLHANNDCRRRCLTVFMKLAGIVLNQKTLAAESLALAKACLREANALSDMIPREYKEENPVYEGVWERLEVLNGKIKVLEGQTQGSHLLGFAHGAQPNLP